MENQYLFCLNRKKNDLTNKNHISVIDSLCDVDLKKKKTTNDKADICQNKMQAVNDEIDEQDEELQIIIPRLFTIDILNYDCLANIFSYLGIGERLDAEKVCLKWKNAVDQLGWHDVTSFDCFDYDFIRKNFGKRFVVQSDLIQILSRCGPYLTHLSFVPKYNSEIMSVVSEHCPNLTKLELYFNVYYDDHFINAFSKMEKLKNIRIRNYIRQRIAGITNDNQILESLPEDIEEISFSTPSLRHSALAKNFAGTFEKFTALRSLTLSHWSLEDHVLKVIVRKRTLTYLSLANCELPDAHLLSGLNNLEYLDVSEVQNICDDLLKNIISNCKNIKHLDISNCHDISKYSLNDLGSAESLKELLVNGLIDFDDSIIDRLQDLKILECRSCTDVTDTGIIRILNNSPTLERLDISDSGVTEMTLKCAIEVTKRRVDNNKLHIIARDELIKQFDGMNNIGQFLVIEECKKKKIIPDNRRNQFNYTIQYRGGRRIYLFNLH